MNYYSFLKKLNNGLIKRDMLNPSYSLTTAFLPNTAVVPIAHYAHCPPMRLKVGLGDIVEEGQLLAEGPDYNVIYSPIPGTVRKISTIRMPSGENSEAVTIDLHGKFAQSGKSASVFEWERLPASELHELLKRSGIVLPQNGGQTLARFLDSDKKITKLIFNGANLEPFIYSAVTHLQFFPDEVFTGLKILYKIFKPELITIVLEEDMRPKLKAFLELVYAGIEGLPLECIFVARHNFTQSLSPFLYNSSLISFEARRRAAQEIYITPSVSKAVFEAVAQRRAVLDSLISLSGGAIRKPSILSVRIGTSVRDLIQECGGFIKTPARIVVNGPLYGWAIHDLDVPVTPSMTGITLLTSLETLQAKTHDCIGCTSCTDHCPQKLEPFLLYRYLEKARPADARRAGLDACIRCGACSYSCPSRIPLTEAFAAAQDAQLASTAALAGEAR